MIEVIYYRDYHRVTMEGHAGAAPIGEDLVCSAASILARTLGENVRHLYQAGAVLDPVISIEEGHAEISCSPKTRYKAITEQIYQSVCVGFEILAANAGEYISFSVRG